MKKTFIALLIIATILFSGFIVFHHSEQSGCVLEIPTANINCVVVEDEYTQESCDKFDVVLSEAFGHPVIFGHDFKTFRSLHETRVGDVITLHQNGDDVHYLVKLSEFGTVNDMNNDVIGIESNKNCLDNWDRSTLSLYTCHYEPGYGKGRWMVVADPIN